MEREISVFYSWQSGAHDKENRYLIGGCLQDAAKQLARDGIRMRVDQDTRDAAGSADIPSTVFQKIEAADFFVGDLSIINPDVEGQRKTPNPNVLLELGYAAHVLGWERTVCVYNTRFGKVEDVPFDIRHRRMLTYDSSGDLQAVKRNLTVKLHRAISAFAEQTFSQHDGDQPCWTAMADLLLAGIRYAWNSLTGQDDEFAECGYTPRSAEAAAPVVLAAHEQQAILLQAVLNMADYALLDDMLAQLRRMRHGTEDADGWEYARALAKQCFDPLWMEYWEYLAPLRPEQCLRQEVVHLLNQLLPEDQQIVYMDLRETDDGKPVFFSNLSHVEAWTEKGDLLIQADLDAAGRITGWKYENTYHGQFRAGIRHGAGTEFHHTIRGNDIRLKGRWENGRFVEGTVCQVVLTKDETAEDGFAYVDEMEDLPLQLFDVQLDSLLHSRMPDECKDLFVGDLRLHDGLFDIIGAPAPLCPILRGDVPCFDCPEDAGGVS